MNAPESVSVIIPVFNSEHSIAACIDSVLAQTHPPGEIIVVNDGSTDDTDTILHAYGEKITTIRQRNQGQGAARNTGIRAATGDFIAFLDADDYWEPLFLERCVAFFRGHARAVAVLTGWTKIIDHSRREIVPPIMNSGSERPLHPMIISDFFRFWMEQDHVQTGAIMIRHDVIQEAGLQREDLRISQDLEYWMLIATYGKWGFIPEPLFVSNSRLNARRNWIDQYRTRRHLCPSVESWQERVVPRIPDREWHYFEGIRGRIAANFSHSKILSGSTDEAKDILKKYGNTMPVNLLTRLMRFGAGVGGPVWTGICQMIRIKEIVKGWKLQKIAAAS